MRGRSRQLERRAIRRRDGRGEAPARARSRLRRRVLARGAGLRI